MVYLLHAHFGRDGREEADELLMRHSGDADKPRILQAFNVPIEDWLSFFMFTYFQDRDGKFQLNALSESGFDPLSRTCRFMLTEEAHHMFVGESGVGRIIQRSTELSAEHDTLDIGAHGGVPLPMIQKYINFHYSICLDLFGQERSTNAANFYTTGLKGRFGETKIDDDHVLDGASYKLPEIAGGEVVWRDQPALTSINEALRDEYRRDSERGLARWNKAIKAAGVDFELTLPHTAFHRNIGTFRDINAAPNGDIISREEWDKNVDGWLPNDADRAHVKSLMVPVTKPGQMANWIAAPARGIHGQDIDFEYVKFH
jgi:benzoyl-CoA 2,3-dioxygenase component B